MEDLNELITLVFQKPGIWDNRLAVHNNRLHVEKCWQEISKVMKIEVKELQKKWKSLRDGFTRELRRRKMSEGNKARRRKKYHYFDKLIFLADVIEDGGSTRFDQQIDQQETSLTHEEEEEEEEADKNFLMSFLPAFKQIALEKKMWARASISQIMLQAATTDDSQSNPLDDLTNQLSNTKVSGEGVSFEGKSLELNNAVDAKVVTDAIAACKKLECLNLEGNTLGVDAARAIGVALATHPELKRALWKDMFTGRMKDEIPQALHYLGSGLDLANVRLVELDLSDNAFGPIGMEGLASLLRSSSCYSLQELRLNNNGLGVTGAKLLSKALTDCYENSKADGKPLPLRVFIAGRNRLENEGVTALAKVFKMIGSLEEIQIPQNGIYHVGIRELSEALKSNQGLRVLNLNDNTLGPKGSTALASVLPSLQMLKHVNLGDCLLKTAGALSIADGLKGKHANLEELFLDYNEIKIEGGLAIAMAMENKGKLKMLSLDGNQFGEEGIDAIKEEVRKNKQTEALGSFSEDEDEDEGEDEDENEDDTEEEEEEDNEGDSEKEENQKEQNNKTEKELTNGIQKEQTSQSSITNVETEMLNLLKKVTAADFLQSPTPVMFLALRTNKTQQILDEIQVGTVDGYLDRFVAAVMKVSSLCMEPSVAEEAADVSSTLYKELFTWAQAQNQLSLVNNSLLVHLGLKGEDKKWRANYNLDACRKALDTAMSQNYFPQDSKDTMRYFLEKKPQVITSKTVS